MVTKFSRLSVGSLLVLGSMSVSAELLVSDAWIREAPPRAKVMAAYMNLKNTGSETVRLSPDLSADFERVEIHDMTMDKGMMNMKKMDQLEIAPGQTVSLSSGGMHVMLFKPSRAMRDGDQAMIALKMESGERQELLVKVKKVDGDLSVTQDEHSHHHSH